MKEQGINLLEKLENEIEQQTRQGRASIYVETEDLKELGYKKIEEGKERQFVDYITLRGLMNRYEFRNGLKVDVQPEIVKNLIEKIDIAEQSMKSRNEESWSK